MCITRDISLVKGEDRKLRVTVYEDGALLDLTGATVYFTMSTPTPVEKDSGTPAEVLILTQSGATLGQLDIFIVPADTASVDVGRYLYDVWVEVSAGERYIVIPTSAVTLSAPVTVIP